MFLGKVILYGIISKDYELVDSFLPRIHYFLQSHKQAYLAIPSLKFSLLAYSNRRDDKIIAIEKLMTTAKLTHATTSYYHVISRIQRTVDLLQEL